MEKQSVEIEGLSIGYQDKKRRHVVAKGISGRLCGGELTCLLGANGIGKSTLLRTLAAFQPRLSGSIYVNGENIDRYSDKQRARIISVVLTERAMPQNLTVFELVGLGRTPYTGFWGGLSAEDAAVVSQALDWVGIRLLEQKSVHNLSDGERQKVMIAKAIAQETPVIYLDEPTAFLDYPSKIETMRLLHRLSRETGKVIFLSTHDMDMALQLADKVWLMQLGGTLCIGTPEDLALQGMLSTFFPEDDVVFDEATGLFRIANTCHSYVQLIDIEGVHASMLRKALARDGIQATQAEAAGRLSIAWGETSEYRLRCADGTVLTLPTIGALMEAIRQRL